MLRYKILVFVMSLFLIGCCSFKGWWFNNIQGKNKKLGYSVQYVDSNLIQVKQKEAVFYRKVYLYDGRSLLNIPSESRKNKTIEVNGNQAIKDSICPLDGDYKFYDRKGKLSHAEGYKNGYPEYFKSYHKSGNVYEYLDFTSRYNDQVGSFRVIIYKDTPNMDKKIDQYFGKNDKNVWVYITIERNK